MDIVVGNTPPPPPPKLTITKHEAARTQNYFTVTLTVKNSGGSDATNIKITDNLLGFQPVDAITPVAEYTMRCRCSTRPAALCR